MKKKMILTVCLTVLGMLSVKAQIAIMALNHQGKATIFKDSQVQDALDAAVDGDTIYLSSGTFAYNFTIKKDITLIGVGMETVIGGNVSIAPDDSITFTSRVLQNIDIQRDITIDKACAGVTISQCRFKNISFNAAIDESNIERSECSGTFYLSTNIKGLQVTTSKIGTIWGWCSASGNANFVNCNIKWFGSDNGDARWWVANYVNCIIAGFNRSYSWINNVSPLASFVNCLLFGGNYGDYTQGVNKDCMTSNAATMGDDWIVTFSDDSSLENYLGFDGTVVGITGTTLPFSLIPVTPRVLEHSFEVNDIGTELKVTLKVGTE